MEVFWINVWGPKETEIALPFYSPVEIYFTVDFPVPGEAFLIEDVSAVDTADTVGVPGLLQHGEDVLVQDRLLARRADHQHRVQEGHQQTGDVRQGVPPISSLLQKMTVSFTIHLAELSCREPSNELQPIQRGMLMLIRLGAINFLLAEETDYWITPCSQGSGCCCFDIFMCNFSIIYLAALRWWPGPRCS